jgi:hypothetical protein
MSRPFGRTKASSRVGRIASTRQCNFRVRIVPLCLHVQLQRAKEFSEEADFRIAGSPRRKRTGVH